MSRTSSAYDFLSLWERLQHRHQHPIQPQGPHAH